MLKESKKALKILTDIPIQNKFLYTFGSKGYDAISGVKATGNLKEAKDEAEASTAKYELSQRLTYARR